MFGTFLCDIYCYCDGFLILFSFKRVGVIHAVGKVTVYHRLVNLFVEVFHLIK